MSAVADIVDLKITVLYTTMIAAQYVDIENGYKILAGMIFIGYNTHRWWIMHKTNQREQAKHKPKNKR